MSLKAVVCADLKIMGCLLAVAAACTLVYFGVRRIISCAPPSETDDIDGGVVKRYWTDVPKVIESAEIVTFHCVISLFAACETDGLGNRIYTLDATLKDGEVLVKYSWRERGGKSDKAEYKADANFMVRLQNIVAAHNFARHNGYYHTVSGLPDMYGESIDIVYASGERIYVHDNQSGFLPFEAEKALVMLFGAATKIENE